MANGIWVVVDRETTAMTYTMAIRVNRDAARHVDPNPVDIFGMSRRANALMEENTEAGKPFFIQLSYYALHYPRNALESTRQAYLNRPRGRVHQNVNRAAITEDLDTGVGMIMDQVEKLGIGDHTYLIYMSDNGAVGGGLGVFARVEGVFVGGRYFAYHWLSRDQV